MLLWSCERADGRSAQAASYNNSSVHIKKVVRAMLELAYGCMEIKWEL